MANLGETGDGVGCVGHASLGVEAPPRIEPYLPLMADAGAQKRIATAPCKRVGEVTVGRCLVLVGMIDAVVVVKAYPVLLCQFVPIHCAD